MAECVGWKEAVGVSGKVGNNCGGSNGKTYAAYAMPLSAAIDCRLN